MRVSAQAREANARHQASKPPSAATERAKRQLSATKREHVHSASAYRLANDTGTLGPWKCAECLQPLPAERQAALSARWDANVGATSKPMPSDA